MGWFRSLPGPLIDKRGGNLLGKSFSGQHTPLGPDVHAGSLQPVPSSDADLSISNCWFNGKIYTTKTGNGSWGIGGIVGAVGKSNDGMTLTISNCLYSGEIVTSATSSSTNVGVGGMIGDRRNAITTITLDNCIVSGTIDTATSNK